MHHFAYRAGVMHAEAVDLVSLAQAVGTPFYCYSTATLERHYRDVLCGRVHTPQDDATRTGLGRAALGL